MNRNFLCPYRIAMMTNRICLFFISASFLQFQEAGANWALSESRTINRFESIADFQVPPSIVAQPPTTKSVEKQDDPAAFKNTGFLDFNLYGYTYDDSDNSITINALANLDYGFQYFSLTNFGRSQARHSLEETAHILTEQNLRWQIPGETPIALAAQALIQNGHDNDVLRFGPRFAVHDFDGAHPLLAKWGVKYWVAVYGAQLDHKSGYQWQMEHVFSLDVFPDIFDRRVYLNGFADVNLDASGSGRDVVWLEEVQLGVRLIDECYFVVEQRYNGFRVGSENSLGIGIEYWVRFK